MSMILTQGKILWRAYHREFVFFFFKKKKKNKNRKLVINDAATILD